MNATTRRLSLLALAFALALPACQRGPAGRPPPDAGPQAPPRFKPPGKCFGKPARCETDAQCGPPFSTCQEGTCCSGTLDPETCECRCGSGPACGPGELCCPGGEWVKEKDRGLRCRPVDECYGPS
jgi:hypothetical protein